MNRHAATTHRPAAKPTHGRSQLGSMSIHSRMGGNFANPNERAAPPLNKPEAPNRPSGTPSLAGLLSDGRQLGRSRRNQQHNTNHDWGDSQPRTSHSSTTSTTSTSTTTTTSATTITSGTTETTTNLPHDNDLGSFMQINQRGPPNKRQSQRPQTGKRSTQPKLSHPPPLSPPRRKRTKPKPPPAITPAATEHRRGKELNGGSWRSDGLPQAMMTAKAVPLCTRPKQLSSSYWWTPQQRCRSRPRKMQPPPKPTRPLHKHPPQQLYKQHNTCDI